MNAEAVYREHRGYVRDLAQYLCQNSADAEDITHETFLLLWSRPREDLGNLKPLLNSLTRFAFWTWRHKRDGWKRLPPFSYEALCQGEVANDDDLEIDEAHEIGQPLVTIMQTPEGAALGRELVELIVEGLDGLSEFQRTTMLALAFGFSCQECGAKLGKSADAVSDGATVGRAKLRRFLIEHGEPDPKPPPRTAEDKRILHMRRYKQWTMQAS